MNARECIVNGQAVFGMEFGSTRIKAVLADPDGRVRGFIEKPSPDRVYTDLVNTGIYLLKPEAMRRT